MVKLRESWRHVKVGAKLGYLTILGHQFRLRQTKNVSGWFCVVECDCGTVKIVRIPRGNREYSASCGCQVLVAIAKNGRANKRHGETGSSIYSIWNHIKDRCNNKSCREYHRYGGQGVEFYKEWMDSYEKFRDYILENGYKPWLQVDRYPDVDGNYEPGNIRFVSSKINNRNRRNTPFVTAFGETKCLSEWAEDSRCKVGYKTLRDRLHGKKKVVWNPEKAISTPPLNGDDRKHIPENFRGTGRDIKTIYEVRGLTKRDSSK